MDSLSERQDGTFCLTKAGYSMSGESEDLEKMVDFDYRHALLTARISTTSTAQLNHVVTKIRTWIRNDPYVALSGGFGLMLLELAHAIVRGQLLSLGLAVVFVVLLVMILFRSAVAGLIGAIPLVTNSARSTW
jgi:hypothetical protein